MAVLHGDRIVKDLIAISFYDYKPVYFLSTVIPEVKWTKINKQSTVKIEIKKWYCCSHDQLLSTNIIKTWTWWTELISWGLITMLGKAWGKVSGGGLISLGVLMRQL